MIKRRVQSAIKQADKKRSQRACVACHCRKVRCDMALEGPPCSSCRFYDLPCVIPLDRRGKAAKESKTKPGEEEFLRNVSNRDRCSNTDRELRFEDKDPQYWNQINEKSAKSFDAILSSRIRPISWKNWLPDFAAPLSPSISNDECKVLHSQGTFDIPNAKTRAELLRNYVDFIHPILPVLDLDEFLTIMDETYEGSQGASFLLFQAVMFAATAFQSSESVTLEGFGNRRALRKGRFERVRTLYLHGCEEDRVALLQTVLLMTYWDDNSQEGYNSSDYVGVAKAILSSIELDPKDTETQMIQKKPGLWRRLRWSCYIRDRLVAIRMRCPIQVEEPSSDTQMLDPLDLEIGPVSTRCCLGPDGSHPAIRDPAVRGLLSQTTISIAQACKHISRILDCQYIPIQFGPFGTSTDYLNVKHQPVPGAEILLRDSELEEWYHSLPELLKWRQSDHLQGPKKHNEVILFLQSMFYGIYNLASAMLHRPQLASVDSKLPEIFELSKQRLENSALAITETFQFFKKSHPNCKPPDEMVAMLESAIITHLVNLKSPDSSYRQLAIDKFQLCAQALQQLGDTFPSADTALAFVDTVVQEQDTSSHHSGASLYHEKFEHSRRFISTMGIGPMSQNDKSIQERQRTIPEQLDDLNIPQMSELLCSHFMMTSSEKSLLQALASPKEEDEDCDPDDASVNSGSQSSLHDPSQTPSIQSHQGAASESPGSSTVDLGDLTTWSLDASGLSQTLEDEHEQSESDYGIFQAISQFCSE